ncbi:MAG: hypothetical protein ACUVSW_18875 [Roseiflexus sp.]
MVSDTPLLFAVVIALINADTLLQGIVNVAARLTGAVKRDPEAKIITRSSITGGSSLDDRMMDSFLEYLAVLWLGWR